MLLVPQDLNTCYAHFHNVRVSFNKIKYPKVNEVSVYFVLKFDQYGIFITILCVLAFFFVKLSFVIPNLLFQNCCSKFIVPNFVYVGEKKFAVVFASCAPHGLLVFFHRQLAELLPWKYSLHDWIYCQASYYHSN